MRRRKEKQIGDWKKPPACGVGALAFAAVLALQLALPEEADARDQEAETFVSNLITSLLDLRKEKAGLDRENALRDRLLESVAFRKLAPFILGPYARKMSKDSRKAYLDLLPEFVTKVYLRRLLLYEGDPIVKIKSSTKKGARNREAIVSSTVKIKGWDEPLPVEWWLWRGANAQYRVFDIGVQGFWIVQQQKAEFTSFLRKNRGNFDKLLERMREQIAKSDAGTLTTAPLIPQ